MANKKDVKTVTNLIKKYGVSSLVNAIHDYEKTGKIVNLETLNTISEENLMKIVDFLVQKYPKINAKITKVDLVGNSEIMTWYPNEPDGNNRYFYISINDQGKYQITYQSDCSMARVQSSKSFDNLINKFENSLSKKWWIKFWK